MSLEQGVSLEHKDFLTLSYTSLSSMMENIRRKSGLIIDSVKSETANSSRGTGVINVPTFSGLEEAFAVFIFH